MIKEGLVFKNTKGNPCVILKVDDKYCWVFAKTKQGFNCNHYGKWYIEECLVKENYRVLANYETWQKAITIYFADKTEDLSQIANMELRDQLDAKEQMIKNYKDLLHSCKIMLLGYRFKQTDVVVMNVTDGLIEKIDEVLR